MKTETRIIKSIIIILPKLQSLKQQNGLVKCLNTSNIKNECLFHRLMKIPVPQTSLINLTII